MSREQLEFLIERIRERAPAAPPTLEESRAAMDAMVDVIPVEPDIACEAVDAGGVPGEWIAAPGAAGDRAVLYLHGGGYAIGSVASHRALVGRISRAAGMRALSVDYRLAPEHPFPAGLEDAQRAYRWLLAQGPAPGRIVIAGDSAGGGLTLATLLSLRDAGEPLPAAGALISPWTDLTLSGASHHSKRDEDPLVDPGLMGQYVDWYTGGRAPDSPLISPLFADLAGLPPLLIQVGTAELLLDDSSRLAEKAREAGVDVTYAEHPDMIHVWHYFAPMLEEGQQAIEALGAFIRSSMPER